MDWGATEWGLFLLTSSSLEPLGWGYPHGNACDPQGDGGLGGNSRFLARFLALSHPGARYRGGQGGAQPEPTCLGAAEICPSCSPLQRKTAAARRGGIIDTGKEERSLSAEPSRQEAGRVMRQAEAKPRQSGVCADASTSRFLQAVRLISSRLPTQTPAVCYVTHHYIFATYGVHHHPPAITTEP